MSFCRIAPLALVLLAGQALAQTTQPKTSDPALKGPSVTQGGVPGENRQFGDGKAKGKDRMGGEIPHKMFMSALDVLRGESAASVRLTSDQETKIKEINEAFTSSVQQYREAHKDEAKALIQQLSPEDRKKAEQYLNRQGRGDGKAKLGGKGKGKGAAPADATDSKDGQTDQKTSADAKAKLRELLEGAPKPTETHTKVFAVLTDAQKPVFQKELDRLKKEAIDKAADRKTEHKNAAKKGGAKPAPSTNSDVNVPSADK